MTRAIVLCMTLALACSISTAATDPVKDCPPGLVCLTRTEAVALRSQELDLRAAIVDLQEKLGVAQAKRLKRLGHNLGCGGGFAVTSASDGGRWEPGLFCGYTFGWRFR